MIREKPLPCPEHLSASVQGLRPSATLTIHERSAGLARQGRTVYRLGFGQSPFPVPQPVVEALQANAHRKEYLPVKGLMELRDAVAHFHRRLDNLPCSADDVLIGPGSKELMFLLQAAYDAELLLPSPSWVSYAPQAQLLGRPVRWIPTAPDNAWKLLPEDLHAACRRHPDRPRILVLNYPNNPTGLTYSAAELEALAAASQHYGLLVLSDEIYGLLHHSGGHVSIARFYPEATIVSAGLSKWCGAGGWRLGTFVFPAGLRWLLDAVAACASETYTTASAPVQYAAVRAFEQGPEIDAYLDRSRRILAALGRRVAARLRAAGLSVYDPHGGFYLFPDFSGALPPGAIATGAELCQRLLDETGVALLPGAAFGRPATELTARLCYVDFDGAACLAAPDEHSAEPYFAKVLDAADLVANWLSRL